MKRIFFERPYRFVFIPVGVAALLSLISYVVMQLWNNLLPAILHVSAITFWQAMGIFILCKILFGFGKGGRGFGGPGNAPWMRRKMEEKFKHLSPEQREQFRQKMESRMCGGPGGRWGRYNWDAEQSKTEPAAPASE